MADLELCYLSATDALERFRARSLSPVELLDALIERAGEVEPTVNALAYRHFDEARDAARDALARERGPQRRRDLEARLEGYEAGRRHRIE